MAILMPGSFVSTMVGVAAKLLPRGFRKKLGRGARRLTRWPPVGAVAMGDLGRTSPISRDWGFDRGRPVDRYYIEAFLETHAGDVRGRVLEMLNDSYTVRYGGDRVEHGDVLHHVPGNPRATVVADLSEEDNGIPTSSYDCIICTQTLQFIYDVHTAVGTLHRILEPGGVLLLAVPGIARISRADMESSGEFWRFTSASLRRLFGEVFRDGVVEIGTHGNVVAAIGYLHGLASEELEREQLETRDPDYEVIITVRAVKAAV